MLLEARSKDHAIQSGYSRETCGRIAFSGCINACFFNLNLLVQHPTSLDRVFTIKAVVNHITFDVLDRQHDEVGV